MPENPDYIFCQVGSNDAAHLLEIKQIQGIPVDQFEKNITKLMTELTTKYKNCKICFIVPPPVAHYPGRTFQQTEMYSNVVQTVFNQLKDQFNNLFLLNIRNKLQQDEYQTIQVDGIHLNEKGNKLYAQMIEEFIGDLPYYRKHWTQLQ